MADTGTLSVATNIFTSPATAFAAIKEKPSPWLPLLLLLLGYCATTYLYMNSVDLPWLLDRQLQQADLTDEQRAQAVDGALRMSPTVIASISAVGTCLVIVIIFALSALYYTGVSFATNTGVKYQQWFALALWCAMPTVLGLLATLVNLLTGDMRFVVQEAINPLAFANLLGIDPEGAPTFQRVLLSLDPTTLWTLVLSVLGYQALSQKSIVHSTLVVLAPLFIIVLISVLVSLF